MFIQWFQPTEEGCRFLTIKIRFLRNRAMRQGSDMEVTPAAQQQVYEKFAFASCHVTKSSFYGSNQGEQ
jgi:hypothetical protein